MSVAVIVVVTAICNSLHRSTPIYNFLLQISILIIFIAIHTSPQVLRSPAKNVYECVMTIPSSSLLVHQSPCPWKCFCAWTWLVFYHPELFFTLSIAIVSPVIKIHSSTEKCKANSAVHSVHWWAFCSNHKHTHNQPIHRPFHSLWDQCDLAQQQK